MENTNQKELDALINLLDDPDKEVNKHVVNKLISLGPSIIPNLEEAWEKTFNPSVHSRLEDVIHIIHQDTLCTDLKEWALHHAEDLLQGAILISKHQYPDINILKIQNRVEKLKKDIWLEMNYNLTPLEQVNVFNHVLYSLNDFRSSGPEQHDPKNSYINCLLETKKGNSISLGILYLVVAHHLQMPVYGVDLPQHFILSYHNHVLQPEDDEQLIRSSILFYINAFNKGVIFTRDDITGFLENINQMPKPENYIPCSNVQVICSMVNHLISCYEINGSLDKVNDLLKMKDALK